MEYITCKNKYLHRESKVKVYDNIRITRTDVAKIMRMMEIAEVATLRTILGKTGFGSIRNVEECQVQNINNWIKRTKPERESPVTRMTTNEIIKMTRDYRPRRGR